MPPGETKLLELIGEETRDRSTVELTLSRPRELADAELEGRVMDALEGARNPLHSMRQG